VANHLQAGKTSEGEDGLQTPQMVARAGDLTRYILYSDPDRLTQSEAVGIRVEQVSRLIGCGGDYPRRLTPLRSLAPLVSLQVVGTWPPPERTSGGLLCLLSEYG
jgi:hypothetical protein